MKKRLIAILSVALLASIGCDKQQEATSEPAEVAENAPTTTEGEGEGAAAEAEAEPEAEAESEATVATVGKPAPDFELMDESGAKHKLSDLKGTMVVLEWTNPECPVVQRVYDTKLMQAAIKDAGAEVKWLAVDSSNFVKPDDSKKWKEKHGVDWPQLQDPSGEVGKLYGAKTTPHMYVIDKEGVLRYNGAIDNDPHGKLDEKERKNFVVEAVTALSAGKEVADAETKPYGCSVKYAGS